MDDNSWLKFIVFSGIGLFASLAIGVFLIIIKLTLAVMPEVVIMGITMY